MRSIGRRWARLAIAGWTLAAPPARAADSASVDRSPEAADARAIEQGSDLTKPLVDPANGGVAGTGLGKMPAAAKAGAGSGQSLKGPAGTGVDTTAPKPIP